VFGLYYIPTDIDYMAKIVRSDIAEFYLGKMSENEKLEWVNLDNVETSLLADAIYYQDVEMVKFSMKESAVPNCIPLDWAEWE
jgi:hypothetical protein